MVDKQKLKNVLVLGALGAGKSTLMTAMLTKDYDIRNEGNKFESSKSLVGFTQDFTQAFSESLGCTLTDSPGVGDSQIPIPKWLASYNRLVTANSRVDLIVILVERKERVDQIDVLTMTLLDQIVAEIKPENLVVVINKCSEDDEDDDVQDWYKEACQQAQCKILPPQLKEGYFKTLRKQRVGKNSQLLKDVPELANALIKYIQQQFSSLIVPILQKVPETSLVKGDFEKVKNAVNDPILSKLVAADESKYMDMMQNMQKQMQEQNDKHTEALTKMMEANQKAAAQAPPPQIMMMPGGGGSSGGCATF